MTTTAPSALTIECAKPDCHWRGSPADAPTHPCPTPAADAAPADGAATPAIVDRFDSETEPKRDHRPSFVIEREKLEEQLRDAGVTFSKDATLDDLRGLAQLTGAAPEAAREPEPEPQLAAPAASTSASEAASTEPAYDSDPETLDELGAWLAAHGQYDANGVPSDERTATLDARYGVLVQEQPLSAEEQETVDALDPPPPVVVTDPAGNTTIVPGTVEKLEPRPWQTAIAAALEQQQEVAAYKWLVVWHPADTTREAELIGRGKRKQEAVVIQEDVIARGQLTGEVIVVKTADVLAAAEIERKRELVDEPDQVVEQPNPEPPADDEPEPTPAPTPDRPAPTVLFDPDDYRDPSLALPQIDGHDIDRIAVAFSGEIMLDRSDKDHVALWRRLQLGREVELWVQAKGIGFAGKGATNRDGELDVVVGKRSVVVQHVRVMGPEELGEAALEVASQARDAAEAQDARNRRPEAA